MERPFIPLSNTQFLHHGLETLIVDCIFHQTKIDIALLIPLWSCTADHQGEDLWAAMLRYLNSTSSCMQCHCVNSSELLDEC